MHEQNHAGEAIFKENQFRGQRCPVQPDEDLTLILKRLGDVTGETINAHDIVICQRVRVTKYPTEKELILEFVHRSERNSVLKKRDG